MVNGNIYDKVTQRGKDRGKGDSTRTDIERALMLHVLRPQALGFWEKQKCQEGDGLLTLQSKQLKEEWK